MMETTDDVILIADDEANILMLLEMELQAEGFKTIGCNDGAKALAQIRESTPALASDGKGQLKHGAGIAIGISQPNFRMFP